MRLMIRTDCTDGAFSYAFAQPFQIERAAQWWQSMAETVEIPNVMMRQE